MGRLGVGCLPLVFAGDAAGDERAEWELELRLIDLECGIFCGLATGMFVRACVEPVARPGGLIVDAFFLPFSSGGVGRGRAIEEEGKRMAQETMFSVYTSPKETFIHCSINCLLLHHAGSLAGQPAIVGRSHGIICSATINHDKKLPARLSRPMLAGITPRQSEHLLAWTWCCGSAFVSLKLKLA